MTTIYARLEIPVTAVPSNTIVGDEHSPDASRQAVKDLEDTGVQWVHEYYWPGDNYYVWVRFAKDDPVVGQLNELGKLTMVDKHYLTHGVELHTAFDKKFNLSKEPT